MGKRVEVGQVWYPRVSWEQPIRITSKSSITYSVLVRRIWYDAVGPEFFLSFSELRDNYMPPTRLHKFLEGLDDKED